nr:MAG TPA: hypothetical protein [Caudoviricetes sp.]
MYSKDNSIRYCRERQQLTPFFSFFHFFLFCLFEIKK